MKTEGQRYLAIDYGQRRIGIAVSDPLFITAQALKPIPNNRDLEKNLSDLVKTYEVSDFVVGWPLNMDGSAGEACEKVAFFIEKHLKNFNLPIHKSDERGSTKAVERQMIAWDLTRAKRKESIDSAAAAFFLQGFMDKA